MIGLFLLAMQGYEYPGHSKHLDYIWQLICLVISFFGLSIRIFTVGHTPKGTSGRNTKKQIADTLNTTGIYSIVRNPLYLGNFFMGLGAALYAHLWWLTLIYSLFFWIYYERIIFAEEAYLRNKFGDQFLHWANRTPAFIPRFSQYKKPNLPFSIKNVLRREYNGFITIIAIMFILETVGDIFSQKQFELNAGWLIILGVSFIIWLILRSLKKYTRILNVEGR